MTRLVLPAVSVLAIAIAVAGAATLVFDGRGEGGEVVAQQPAPPSAPPAPLRDPLFEKIDAALRALPEASAAFNAPAEAEQGESVGVQLLVSLERSIGELETDLTEIGEREGARIRVSPVVEARLTGSGFDIEALTPERQPIGSTGTTEWRWTVEGTEAGKQRLHLTMSALIVVEGERTPRAIRTFDRDIDIHVSFDRRAADFVEGNWQWLWAAVVVPLIPFLVGTVRRRRAGGTPTIAYVRGSTGGAWHWCKNCSDYPREIEDSRTTRPRSRLCSRCTAKQRRDDCEA